MFGMGDQKAERDRKTNEAVRKGLLLAQGLMAAGSAVPGIGGVCSAAQNRYVLCRVKSGPRAVTRRPQRERENDPPSRLDLMALKGL